MHSHSGATRPRAREIYYIRARSLEEGVIYNYYVCCIKVHVQCYYQFFYSSMNIDYKERTKDSSFNSVILIVVILSLLLLLLVTVVSVITIVLYRQKKRGEYSLGKAAQKDAGEEQTE